MQRADLTTHRRSRPSARVASASRRPRVGSCDHDRPGRRVHARRPARGPRRWAIRWAKPGRIGPYRAHHHSPAMLPDIAYLQVLSGSTRPRTRCFTRERTLVRNQPRPSRKGRICRAFLAGGVRHTGRPRVRVPGSPLPRPGGERTCRASRRLTRERSQGSSPAVLTVPNPRAGRAAPVSVGMQERCRSGSRLGRRLLLVVAVAETA
jgi:hypothetical protein